jgi:hypothetical protein
VKHQVSCLVPQKSCDVSIHCVRRQGAAWPKLKRTQSPGPRGLHQQSQAQAFTKYLHTVGTGARPILIKLRDPRRHVFVRVA